MTKNIIKKFMEVNNKYIAPFQYYRKEDEMLVWDLMEICHRVLKLLLTEEEKNYFLEEFQIVYRDYDDFYISYTIKEFLENLECIREIEEFLSVASIFDSSMDREIEIDDDDNLIWIFPIN